MYCPRCAAENGDDSKFCRRCGTDISLVPQALSRTLPETSQGEAPVNQYAGKIESGVKKSFMGLGFILISLAMLAGRNHDWWIMLVPAAVLLGKGISQILTLWYAGLLIRPKVAGPNRVEPIDQPPQRRFLESAAPPSVTEQTTRNINAQARQRPES